MNERANELIKSIPDLKYDANTGMFETDRRALYDLVELTIRECANMAESFHRHQYDFTGNLELHEFIKQHFGVEE